MTDNPALAAIERKRNYLTLDGMRGVAALAVVSRHLVGEMAPIDLPGSYLAVDMFFAMSGFVLAHSYDDRLAHDLTKADFVRNRMVRLYPLYFASIVIVAVGVVAALAAHLAVNWSPASLSAAVALGLLFLPTPPAVSGMAILFPLNGPAWSLFMEMAVNIVYAVARPLLTMRGLVVVLIASAAGLAGAILAHGNADIGADWATLAIAPPRVLFSFFLGVAFYRWDRADRLPRLAVSAWGVLALLIVIFAAAFTGAARTMFDLVAVFVLLPALVVAGIQNQPRRLGGLFTILGVTSYPIYVLHVPLQKYSENAIGKLLGSDVAAFAPAIGVAMLAAMLPIGWLANRCYDAPARRALGRLLRPRPDPTRV